MKILVIAGTGTEVGKTVVTAAVAALARDAGRRTAVVKPVQTGVPDGEPGDLAVVGRLSGVEDLHELARYPDPLAPETAARRARSAPPGLTEITASVRGLVGRELVLIEGSGGLLVRYDPAGTTIADVAQALGAAVLIVASPSLGTLNVTALTAEAVRSRRLRCAGVVIGSWPDDPDQAARANVTDLPVYAGAPLVGALPEESGRMWRQAFLRRARDGLAPSLGGRFDAARFTQQTARPRVEVSP
ncbi:MAG: dethiobiotin synthase [Frankiaceae bacterium]